VAGTDVLPLTIADMDLPLDPVIRQAIETCLQHPLGYRVAHTDSPLGATLATFFGSVPDAFWLTAGTVATTYAIAAQWLTPGDEAVYFAPSYFAIPDSIRAAGGVAVPVPLDPFTTPAWDPDQLRRAMSPRTRFIHLCHPHNPTGHRFSRDELTAIAAVARDHGVPVLSNELHARIALDADEDPTTEDPATTDAVTVGRQSGAVTTVPTRLAPHVPMFQIAPDLTVTITGATKSHNVSGIGGAVVHAAPTTIDDLQNRIGHTVPRATGLQQAVLQAAYASDSAWLRATRRCLRASRDRVADAVLAALPGVRVTRPAATYLLWLDLADVAGVDNADDIEQRFGIRGLGGDAFEASPHYVRFTHATHPALIDVVCARLSRPRHAPT
jgi:cystathionine beta-lyase